MIDNLMGILMSIKTTDIIDIVVVAYLIYRLLGFIKETRALRDIQSEPAELAVHKTDHSRTHRGRHTLSA